MAKARRRLSDLVQEETQKVRDPGLQTSEVTNPVSLLETSSKTDSVEEVTEQQTFNDTDLQISDVSESVPFLQVAIEEKGNEVNKITEIQSLQTTDLQTSEVTKSQSLPESSNKTDLVEEVTEQQTSNDMNLQTNKLPKYLKLERKEARLRQDQIDALTDLTRKLNRMKRSKGGERLTDNTLIRVAVDLLLSKASELQGTTEEELRSSLNL
ncbi:hypothetical protein ACEYW6_30275 [Nostoc sp. UIC 10607]|uniref:hypothetical protein n=1 Tax=Nostoc sp. UIC 10607 TaxID=3045935 RepID=UPI0039A350B9